MDRLVVVKFHTNIANTCRQLFMSTAPDVRTGVARPSCEWWASDLSRCTRIIFFIYTIYNDEHKRKIVTSSFYIVARHVPRRLVTRHIVYRPVLSSQTLSPLTVKSSVSIMSSSPSHVAHLRWPGEVASICTEDWGPKAKLLFWPSFSPLFTPPPPHLPLEIGPLKCSRGVRGSAVSSSNGVWCGAPAEIEFCTFFIPQNLTSSGNDSTDFPDNPLAKFMAV